MQVGIEYMLNSVCLWTINSTTDVVVGAAIGEFKIGWVFGIDRSACGYTHMSNSKPH